MKKKEINVLFGVRIHLSRAVQFFECKDTLQYALDALVQVY